MSRFLVDVCIPVYKEKGYIERTLKNLSNQNLFKQGKVHIIVGEYKDPEARYDFYVRNLCTLYPNFDYLRVDKRGIGYARNEMAKIALSDIIMCFDSDAIFNRYDAIELMIAPILDKKAVMTNCECIPFDFIKKKRSRALDLNSAYDIIAGFAEKSIVARGPGLTVSKEACFNVGGFRDIPSSEDYYMSIDIITKYGIGMKQFIPDVKILASDRRDKAFQKQGISAYNFENAFR